MQATSQVRSDGLNGAKRETPTARVTVNRAAEVKRQSWWDWLTWWPSVAEVMKLLDGIFQEVDSPLMHFVLKTTELIDLQVVLSFKFYPGPLILKLKKLCL